MALPRVQVALAGLTLLVLLLGLWAGLLRLALPLPPAPPLALAHGPLMVEGFLGTLIALERAASLARSWAYLAPALNVLGAVLLASGIGSWFGALLLAGGSVALLAVFLALLQRQRALPGVTMTLGALMNVGGSLLWIGGAPLLRVVPWWTAFLVLVVGGERLELARLGRVRLGDNVILGAALSAILLGPFVDVVDLDWGTRLFGFGLVSFALWLARHDVARHMIGRRGLPGYMAVCLYLGYVWLVVSGLVRLTVGALVVDAAYDLALHAVFLGFALGLVFAHAPIIFPAVTGRPLPYRPSFFAPLLLLQTSLALRAGGDLANVALARQLGGIGNELAIVLFLAVTAGAIRTGARSTALNPRPAVLEGRVSVDDS